MEEKIFTRDGQQHFDRNANWREMEENRTRSSVVAHVHELAYHMRQSGDKCSLVDELALTVNALCDVYKELENLMLDEQGRRIIPMEKTLVSSDGSLLAQMINEITTYFEAGLDETSNPALASIRAIVERYQRSALVAPRVSEECYGVVNARGELQTGAMHTTPESAWVAVSGGSTQAQLEEAGYRIVSLRVVSTEHADQGSRTSLTSELSLLINRYSQENGSDTPDFILAKYLARALENWNETIRERERWYGRKEISHEDVTTHD